MFGGDPYVEDGPRHDFGQVLDDFVGDLSGLFQGKQRGVSWGWTAGKVEWAFREVRGAIDDRPFGLRNAFRTNLLLDLIRVRLNRQDRYDDYLAELNALITDPATNLIPQRLHNDPPRTPLTSPLLTPNQPPNYLPSIPRRGCLAVCSH